MLNHAAELGVLRNVHQMTMSRGIYMAQSLLHGRSSSRGVCSALDNDDQIISTHRGHGHCIAKGADINLMMAELYGRETGYCKGKGARCILPIFL